MASSGVRGGAQVAGVLRTLARGLDDNHLREIRRDALRPMQLSARQNFAANGSFKTGVIPGDIEIVDTGRHQTSLGMTGMGAKLGHIIEMGAAPHEQPNRGTYHPGTEPKPFMRPAYDEQRDHVMRKAGEAIATQLLRIARAARK